MKSTDLSPGVGYLIIKRYVEVPDTRTNYKIIGLLIVFTSSVKFFNDMHPSAVINKNQTTCTFNNLL